MKRPAVVLVTYGHRADLCIRAVQAALEQGVETVVVVGQNVAPDSADALTTFSSAHPAVRLHLFADNPGSAVGFERAMNLAVPLAEEFVLVLDDDNELQTGAVQALLEEATSCGGDPRATILFAYRSGDTSQRLALAGRTGAYPPPGSFLYFDLFSRVGRFTGRKEARGSGRIEVPYGPYGGMMIPRALLQAGARPDRRFVLYEDDTEFTMRLRAAGARLFLTGRAEIRDLDDKWSRVKDRKTSGVRGLLQAEDHRRRRHAVRNRVAVDLLRAGSAGSRFRLNRSVYTIVLVCIAVASRRVTDLRSILAAISEGRNFAAELTDATR